MFFCFTGADLGEGDEGEWEEGEEGDWEDEEADEEEDDGSFLTPTAKQIPDSQKTVNYTQVGPAAACQPPRCVVPLAAAEVRCAQHIGGACMHVTQ